MRTITCREAERLMHLEADGQRTDPESAALALHLNECASCAAQHQRLARLQTILAAVPSSELHEGVWQRICAGAAERVRKPPRSIARRLVPVATVAALLVVGVIGIRFFMGPRWALASTLKALNDVETFHAKSTDDSPLQCEAWYARGAGYRTETAERTELATAHASVLYDKRQNRVFWRLPDLDAYEKEASQVLGAPWGAGLLPGKASKRTGHLGDRRVDIVEIDGPQGLFRVYVDPETRLAVRLEQWSPEGRELRSRGDVGYGVQVPPHALTFEAPDGTEVIDLRVLPLARARDAAKTRPWHTVEARRPLAMSSQYDLDEVNLDEDWHEEGVGHRHEEEMNRISFLWHDGTLTELYATRPLRVAERPRPLEVKSPAPLETMGQVGWLTTLLEISVDKVTQEGRQAIRLTAVDYDALGGRRGSPGVATKRREVFWFDEAVGVITEWRTYIVIDGEWRWVRTRVTDYPPGLPADTFEPVYDWHRPEPPVWDEARKQELIELLVEE